MRNWWSACLARAGAFTGGVLVAVVGCTLAVAGCATGRAAPQGQASAPEAAGTRAAIPAGAMLAPGDLAGAGWRSRGSASPSAWRWALRQCILYDPAQYPAQQHRAAARSQSFQASGRPAGREVTEQVELFAAGWGTRSLDDTRRVLETCGRYEYTDAKNDFLESHAILADSFAGDEALLVETTRIAPPGPTRVHYTAVVRKGDLVVTVTATGLGPDAVRHLATVALTRLG
jgi:hypothetical protein